MADGAAKSVGELCSMLEAWHQDVLVCPWAYPPERAALRELATLWLRGQVGEGDKVRVAALLRAHKVPLDKSLSVQRLFWSKVVPVVKGPVTDEQ